MIATYRLQLHPDFGFAEVQARLPYFRRLGVSHLYLSPVTAARRGSTHGYDVVDHNEVSETLGGRDGLFRLLDACAETGLRVILDWVPNHAGVGPRNAAWQDVLAYGPHSPHARYFDIDWEPLKPELRGKVLLPFLGRPYGEVLDDGELTLTYEDGRFAVAYFESRFALAPATYATILEAALPRFEREEAYWDLKDLTEAYRGVAPHEREKAEALRLRLAAFARHHPPETWLEGLLDREALHDLLERQPWRLATWLTAGHEINYRRFFDINELVGLRMEDEQVFWDAHRLAGELLAHPAVEGLRVDHIDGLFDPHAYLRRLRELGAQRVWVEKILAPGETLPEGWITEGETGYAFLNDALHLLLDPHGEHALDRTYRRLVPDARPWDEEVHRSKRLVMGTALQSELSRLAYQLDRLSEADYHTRDFTLDALHDALAEVVAAFERYRTYLPHDPEEAREVVAQAVALARQRNPAAEPTVFAFVQRAILGDLADGLREAQRAWVGRFQQYTAPVAAKGVEDTAFYRFVRHVALNEVGGEPNHGALPTQAFHARNRFRALRYPRNLLATATHDHKRGEDTRMRLLALAELPQAWEDTALRLAELGQDHRSGRGPDPADMYLLHQTLAALWHPDPAADADAYRAALPDRLAAYALKAAREAKRRTSWINPDEAYEATLEAYVRGLLADERLPETLDAFAAQLARLGLHNALSQLVLKLTAPGVPDLYQGAELPDLSLVDPDNRRPVDYDARETMLSDLADVLAEPRPETVRSLLTEDGARAKLYATARLLHLRAAHPDLFGESAYHALEPEGEGAEGWVAFARTTDEAAVVVAVSRYPARFPDVHAARIPLPKDLHGHRWMDALSGTVVEPTEALEALALPLPWAVLVHATTPPDTP